MDLIFVAVITFLSAFTQGLSGFGSALVAMALLPGLLTMKAAAPLVALQGLCIDGLLLLHYRQALNLRAIWRVALASVFTVPLGVWALRGLNERILMVVLGLLLAGYGIYSLFNIRLPKLDHPIWAYLAGMASGLLGGAYNTSGPPVIVYADCRRWQLAEFKSNLQGLFLLDSILVVASHYWGHSLTAPIMSYFWWTAPLLAFGAFGGIAMDRFLNPQVFRKVVLVLLILRGLRLIFF
jgi:uncharacterized protein